MKSVENSFERVLCRQYNNRTYLYNFLAMPWQISDDTEVRNSSNTPYNMLETDKLCKPHCFVHPCLWLITWDPTQPVATRPLAIQKDGTWYTYGWDLTKNICEVFGQNGYIRSTYAYTPFGSITTSGDINQPIQWSSEYYDNELALVYYNYRHYNPTDGRWINRDSIAEQGGWNLYGFVGNKLWLLIDRFGLIAEESEKIFWGYVYSEALNAADIFIESQTELTYNSKIFREDVLSSMKKFKEAVDSKGVLGYQYYTKDFTKKASKVFITSKAVKYPGIKITAVTDIINLASISISEMIEYKSFVKEQKYYMRLKRKTLRDCIGLCIAMYNYARVLLYDSMGGYLAYLGTNRCVGSCCKIKHD